MSGIASKAHSLTQTIKDGSLLTEARHRWKSELVSFGLRRDLTIPFQAPQANIPLTVRPIRDSDIPKILNPDAPSISDETREEIKTRLQMLEGGIAKGYVAATGDDDEPCYMQWLIGPDQNSKVQAYFHGLYPLLKGDEALLEGAYTPEAYRGQRIMPCAMAQLAEKGTDIGARWVITFVTHDNIASLKGCKRSGFAPYLTRRDRWSMFRRQITFTPLPDGTPYPFD